MHGGTISFNVYRFQHRLLQYGITYHIFAKYVFYKNIQIGDQLVIENTMVNWDRELYGLRNLKRGTKRDLAIREKI